MPSNKDKIIQQLSDDISTSVGNIEDGSLQSINDNFYKVLSDNLETFNSFNFDTDGFIKRFSEMDVGSADKNMINKILTGIKTDQSSITGTNQNDILLKRDISNICLQMPEMRDVVYTVRDAIVESDVVTGEISRSLIFQNRDSAGGQAIIKDLEDHYGLQKAIKNFIIPHTLMIGEYYVNIVPYSKLFAEVDAINAKRYTRTNNKSKSLVSFESGDSLYNDDNLKYIKESVSAETIAMIEDETNSNNINRITQLDDRGLTSMLQNISVHSESSSVLMQELGMDGVQKLLESDKDLSKHKKTSKTFFEDVVNGFNNGVLDSDKIDAANVPYKKYSNIKGCYIKYLDPLRVIPIHLDRRVIGYCYVSTKTNNRNNPAQPSGVIDVSINHYTRDRKLVNSLANIIINSFDKQMLDTNINLKNEIADVLMAHKFSESRLSFIYIPENEIVRFAINEDENNKGHSIIEPSLFPARMYMLLTMYNMIFTLNNNTTRIHYLKSSGLNKDYSSQIQRTMRKFQSRRITIDDIYSYNGVINKVGGIGEMVLPAGRGSGGEFKAIETDTIAAVDTPVNTEFLEQMRRQAISGTGVPALMVINALDEVDFAKTLELANTRFLSTVSSYKIDFNQSLTNLYKLLIKYNTTDIDDSELNSFLFKFNNIKQPALNITNQMINDFKTLNELVEDIFFSRNDLEDENNKPSNIAIVLKRKLAEEYLPQLDYDKLDSIVEKVKIEANRMTLEKKASETTIEKEDIEKVDK